MPRSKRTIEGYLQIDHRDSPGVSGQVMQSLGLPGAAGRGLIEAPTFTCSHCQTVVIMNPERTRAREYCAKCNRYICDRCGAIMASTGECLPFQKIIDLALAGKEQ